MGIYFPSLVALSDPIFTVIVNGAFQMVKLLIGQHVNSIFILLSRYQSSHLQNVICLCHLATKIKHTFFFSIGVMLKVDLQQMRRFEFELLFCSVQ